jgi:hypothetical protein
LSTGGKGQAQVGFKKRLKQGTGVFKRLDFPFLPGGIWLVCGWVGGGGGLEGGRGGGGREGMVDLV